MNRDHGRPARTVPAALCAAALMGTFACSSFWGGEQMSETSVEEHEQEASVHEAKESAHEGHYDPNVSVELSRGTSQGREDQDKYSINDYNWGERRYNPTERHLEHAARHQQHASAHRKAAQALEQFEESECSAFPPETRALCPLIGQVRSEEEIPGGVRVRFADGVNVEAATAHIRCHLAFARARGYQGMDRCPLYIRGVRVLESDSDPGAVDLLADDETDVTLLREQVAEHVAAQD